MRSSIILALALLVSACGTPRLPDPTISCPMPPEALMQPAPNLSTIPETK